MDSQENKAEEKVPQQHSGEEEDSDDEDDAVFPWKCINSQLLLNVDIDGDGLVSKDELIEFLVKAGMKQPHARKHVDTFYAMADPLDSGTVELRAFVTEFKRMTVFRMLRFLRQNFNEIDVNGDGLIDRAEYYAALSSQVDDVYAAQAIDSIFYNLDIDGNEALDLNEFKKWYLKQEQEVRSEQKEKFNIKHSSHECPLDYFPRMGNGGMWVCSNCNSRKLGGTGFICIKHHFALCESCKSEASLYQDAGAHLLMCGRHGILGREDLSIRGRGLLTYVQSGVSYVSCGLNHTAIITMRGAVYTCGGGGREGGVLSAAPRPGPSSSDRALESGKIRSEMAYPYLGHSKDLRLNTRSAVFRPVVGLEQLNVKGVACGAHATYCWVREVYA